MSRYVLGNQTHSHVDLRMPYGCVSEEPGAPERGGAVHTGPDSFAGNGDVVDLPAAHVGAGVNATE